MASPATVLWLEPDGAWTEDPTLIAARLEQARTQVEIANLPPSSLNGWLSLLARPVRERLMLLQCQRWAIPDPPPAARCLVERVQRLVRDAARSRDGSRLSRLQEAMAFLTGGHTAGEARLLEQWAEAPEQDLEQATRSFPRAAGDWGSLEVRLTGLVFFGPEAGAGSRLHPVTVPG
jgi:hypothetical protein